MRVPTMELNSPVSYNGNQHASSKVFGSCGGHSGLEVQSQTRRWCVVCEVSKAMAQTRMEYSMLGL